MPEITMNQQVEGMGHGDRSKISLPSFNIVDPGPRQELKEVIEKASLKTMSYGLNQADADIIIGARIRQEIWKQL